MNIDETTQGLNNRRLSVCIYRHTLGRSSEPWIWQQATRFRSSSAHFLCRELDGAIAPGLACSEFLQSDQRSSLSRLQHGVLAGPTNALRALERAKWIPAVVHAHFAFDALYARRITKRLNIPLVVTLHGIDVAASNTTLIRSMKLAWWRLLLERRKLAVDATLFICVSDHIRNLARRYYPEHKLRVAFLGIDTNFFEPAALINTPSILFVGRLVEKKGAEYLIEAFSRVKAAVPAATLTIVGTGPLEGVLHEKANACGAQDSVRFIKKVSQSEVKTLVAGHRLFCLPSVTARNGDTEGLPISLLEAMASARPVVSTYHAGIPQAIEHGVDGLLSKERDVPTLAENLLSALQSDDLAARLGRNARRKVEEQFDLTCCAARTEALYGEALALFARR